MKSEPKPFASLSSGLLARKGAARPAMKPQGFGQVGGGNLEDLGWNDMGFEPPKPVATDVRDEDHDAFGEELGEQPLRNPVAALTPIGSPVHDQQAELADRFGAPDEDEETDETAELYEAEAAEPAEVVRIPAPKPQAAAPRRQPRPRSAPGANGKAAFTLRLDPARHLKLRLACAVNGRSAQQLVTDALDQLLAEMPELDSMAERAPAAKRAHN
jgi:hypothetical protein